MAKVIQVCTIEILYKEKLKKVNHKGRLESGFMHVHLHVLHDNAPAHQSELGKS